MTNYAFIFGASLVLNLSLTVRSSDYCKEFIRKRKQRNQRTNQRHHSQRQLRKSSSRSFNVHGDYDPNNKDENNETDDDHDENWKQNAADLLKWKALRKQYLSVYLCATMADWLQGPYVYALYASYGYTQHEIAILFVAAFASSMILGSLVAAMADWAGRRAFVLLFAVVYASSCITKHFNHFGILLVGRLLGGVATSLLFSVFEAWWIRAHTDAGLKAYLGKSFSWAAYGNSIVAIAAGLIANKAAGLGHTAPLYNNNNPMETATGGGTVGATSYVVAQHVYVGGFLNPFDIAICSLMVCGVRAAMTWEENYGGGGGGGNDYGSNDNSTNDGAGGVVKVATDDSNNKQPAATWHGGIQTAVQTVVRSTDILLCGLISSLFEGSMYIFVFMWTPALTEREDIQLPFGLIFSTFMVCCMAGSSAYSILLCTSSNTNDSNGPPPLRGEQVAVGLFAVAAGSMLVIATATQASVKFLAMNLFEFCVGMYWPIMATQKGSIVPESMRAAIYGIFRVPLNLIVLSSLMTDLTPTQSFALNFYMLGTACVLQTVLMKRRELHQGTTSFSAAPPSTATARTTSPSSSTSPSSLSSLSATAAAAATKTASSTLSASSRGTRATTTKRKATTIRRGNSSSHHSELDPTDLLQQEHMNNGSGGPDELSTTPLLGGTEAV